MIYTVAGNGGSGYSGDGGPATVAHLNYPSATAVDHVGNLLIADVDNNVVRMVSAATGTISTFAGKGTGGYSGDNGAALSAQLSSPSSLAIDNAGNVYIADAGNNVVRKVAAGTGTITTVAGTGTAGFSGDAGPAASAELSNPMGVAVDGAGNLYIADRSNNRVRQVLASTGTITTVIGSGQYGYTGDGGPATNATMDGPDGVATDAAGNVYVADQYNNVVRKWDASLKTITTVAGNGYGAGSIYYPGGATPEMEDRPSARNWIILPR